MIKNKDQVIGAFNGLLQKGDIVGAHRIVEQAYRNDPDDPDITFLFARTKFDQRAFDVAAKAAKSLLQRFPAQAELQDLYLQSLIEGQQYQTAVKEAERIAKRNPSLHLDLAVARAYGLWGKSALAIRKLDAVIAQHPKTHEAHAMRGILLNQLGRKEEGIAALEQASRLAPSHTGYLFDLASLLLGNKQYDPAEQVLSRLMEIDANHYPALKTLGEMHFKKAHYPQALTFFEKILKISQKDLSVWVMYLTATSIAGDPLEAAKLAESVLQRYPNNPNIMSQLAFARCRAGLAEPALATCEQLKSYPETVVTALAIEAATLNKQARQEEAASILCLDTLVQGHVAAPPENWPSVGAFNAALTQEILSHPDLGEHATNRSLVREQCTFELFSGSETGAIAGLRSVIEREIADYLAAFAASDIGPSAYRAAQPKTFKLECWANVMSRGGNHEAHFHPRAWLSGVYYPCLPDGMSATSNAGALELGCSMAEFLPAIDEPTVFFKPEEGSIVMFPSYVGHRTVPIETNDKPRISLAFNVVADTTASAYKNDLI